MLEIGRSYLYILLKKTRDVFIYFLRHIQCQALGYHFLEIYYGYHFLVIKKTFSRG